MRSVSNYGSALIHTERMDLRCQGEGKLLHAIAPIMMASARARVSASAFPVLLAYPMVQTPARRPPSTSVTESPTRTHRLDSASTRETAWRIKSGLGFICPGSAYGRPTTQPTYRARSCESRYARIAGSLLLLTIATGRPTWHAAMITSRAYGVGDAVATAASSARRNSSSTRATRPASYSAVHWRTASGSRSSSTASVRRAPARVSRLPFTDGWVICPSVCAVWKCRRHGHFREHDADGHGLGCEPARSVVINNPSGFLDRSQQAHHVPWAIFDRSYAGRGIVLGTPR